MPLAEVGPPASVALPSISQSAKGSATASSGSRAARGSSARGAETIRSTSVLRQTIHGESTRPHRRRPASVRPARAPGQKPIGVPLDELTGQDCQPVAARLESRWRTASSLAGNDSGGPPVGVSAETSSSPASVVLEAIATSELDRAAWRICPNPRRRQGPG